MSLELHETGYRYPGGFALKPVTLSIPRGKFLALMGPNGSGKTTLLSLMGGRLKPSEGTITLGGTSLFTLSPKQRARRLGLVPQINEQTFDYTVREMIGMGRFPHQPLFGGGKSPKDVRLVEELLERLNLVEIAHRSVLSLSGGEYQRVLLGRVLAQEPKILLLDEPGNHLDLNYQTSFLDLAKEEAARGKTVIAILHDINQALHYGDLGLLLYQGRPLDMGAPRDILTPERLEEVYGLQVETFWSSDGSRRVFGPSSWSMSRR